MSVLFSLSTLFGLMVLFTSIGGDAVGLGVAAVLILVGSAGKAWIDNRASKAAAVQGKEMLAEIRDNHVEAAEQLAELNRAMVKLSIRIDDLEAAVTAPDTGHG